MAEISKGKNFEDISPHRFPRGGNWRSRGLLQVPSEESCALLKLPIGIVPENRDYNDAKNTLNVQHLVSTQEGAPWDGYYATLNGAKIAVSAYCGVWFEIERRGESWQAI
jgi:hypothetical protein